MDKAVSAADANRRFSELLRTVKKGRSGIVTSHGKPVAKITPVAEDERVAEGARTALFARLQTERAVNVGRWRRDELYDDGPVQSRSYDLGLGCAGRVGGSRVSFASVRFGDVPPVASRL